MLKRPKPGEDEEDLFRMQEEYLREKNKNQDFQPAAAVTNLRPKEPPPLQSSIETGPGVRKPSKYAQNRGLINQKARLESSSVMGDVFEKNTQSPSQDKEPELDDDQVYFPKVIPSLLGNIVEKNLDDFINADATLFPSQGFPAATKRDLNIIPGKMSIHAQQLEKVRKEKINVDEPTCSNTKPLSNVTMNLPERSYVLSSDGADQIHSENLSFLGKMSEKEILEEQQKILATLDPGLVKFLKAKRQGSTKKDTYNQNTTVSEPKLKIEEQVSTSGDIGSFDHDTLWENDVLSHPNVDEWLNFNSLEKDKLEWIKGMKESRKIKANEPYEARFNFKGYLMPYTIEYTEKTKTLFHHGEEPHRPGYSLTELFELTRSSVTQQKVMALNTLAGVLEYFSAGTYKDVIDIPLSKIFFVVRIAIDENKGILLEPALKAMRNLVYNRIDEACLDALIGFEEGTQQPCLQNDMSEIAELESQESELKDFHLAEIDIIAALLRTDIIQRIYYILETVRPSFNCVQYCLQILTRLARDSVETAQKLLESDHLMNTVIKNFVPTTSINFAFDPQIVYNGKPVLAALKFIRVLSLQSPEIASTLATKYDIFAPVSEYISSGIDGTYGLRIQIEAYCILTNCLIYGVGIENAMSLCPIIVTTMYKHVQGTGVLIDASVISATHAAVVLQLVNTILKYRIRNIDSYKQQIYPLLKEGVQKWLGQLSISDHYICGHLRLLCSALDCCKTVLFVEQIPLQFLNESLKVFAKSMSYKKMVKQLVPSSNLLSGVETKDLHLVKNLMGLGGSVIDTAQKVLPILNVVSPIPFLASLFKLLEFIECKEVSKVFVAKTVRYLRDFAQKTPSLCENWFTRLETDFLFSVVRLSSREQMGEADKDLIYAVANKLCYILRIDKRYELDFLFNNIVFNKNWFTTDRLVNLMSLQDTDGVSQGLTAIEQIRLCYNEVINLEYKGTGQNIVLKMWQEPILPRDWIYIPILNMYSDSQESDPSKGANSCQLVFKDKWKEFIISSCLEWILFNEVCFSDLLKDIDITDRFCRIMCVYLCDGSLFLDEKINLLLKKCLRTLFKREKNMPFNFNKELAGLQNFQDFYTQFLEQFQAVSYGESTFASCVLVPLAQKHDVKWRKLLWSEYAGCLRALDCPEDQLCYELKEYFEPEETDESLIKSYSQALSSNLLRPNTISHKIASHHLECFKNRIRKSS